MRPAHPNVDTKPISSKERASADTLDSTRRLLSQDGLHTRANTSSPSPELDPDEPTRERALLALVSSARHELRSPLQSIQGFADLLASESYGPLGGDQRVFVDHIIQGSWDLSRALDACFDLIQAEALHLPTEPLRASLRRLLDESLAIAENNGPNRFETHFEALDVDLCVEVDLHDFSKAIEAVITAIAPLSRGPLHVSASPRDGSIELTFGVSDEPRTFRSLSELPRRGVSARALLWLRLASALVLRSNGRLETSEGYDQVRLLLPLRRDD